MSGRYPMVVVAVLLVLLGINLWLWPNTDLQLSTTSFGVGGEGYKAAYDLLSELGLPVSRSYAALSQVPGSRPLWLVSPSLLDSGQKDSDVDPDAHALLKWIDSGGTAVVFGEPGSVWKKLGIKRSTSEGGETSTIEGDLAPLAREVPVSGLLHFSAGSDKARVRLRSGQAPFVLEMKLGAGRLIAIADGRFLRNVNLAHGDSSVLAFDLAHALGVPVIDERCHGLAAPSSLLALIVDSRAVVPLGLGLLATLLWIAEQRRWPRRTLADPAPGPQPSIGSFVESLGVLYSRVPDPQAVFRAYRSGFVRRLGKQLSPRAEVPEDRVIDRLARRWLVNGVPPRDEKELVVAIRAIESYPKAGR